MSLEQALSYGLIYLKEYIEKPPTTLKSKESRLKQTLTGLIQEYSLEEVIDSYQEFLELIKEKSNDYEILKLDCKKLADKLLAIPRDWWDERTEWASR